MVLERKICRNVIKDFLKKDSFSFNELKNTILGKGGFLRVYGGLSLGEFVDGLEEENLIYFDPKTREYSPAKNVPEKTSYAFLRNLK